MRFANYIASLTLHIGLFLIIFFWPAQSIIRPERPIQISLTMGAIGGSQLPSAVLGPKVFAPSQATAATASAPIKNIPIPSAIPIQSKPEPISEAQIQKKTQPEAIAIPEKKLAKKQIEQLQTNVSEKKQKNTQSAVEPPKKIVKKESGTSGEASLKAALADAKKKAKDISEGSPILTALAGFKKEAAVVGGGGGVDNGGGGGGIYDVYAGMVMMAVKPNWSIPTYSRDNLVALVRVQIDPQGSVLSCVIEESSGRADFDASAVNAVIRTKVLPVPPTPSQQDIVIAFNALESR